MFVYFLSLFSKCNEGSHQGWWIAGHPMWLPGQCSRTVGRWTDEEYRGEPTRRTTQAIHFLLRLSERSRSDGPFDRGPNGGVLQTWRIERNSFHLWMQPRRGNDFLKQNVYHCEVSSCSWFTSVFSDQRTTSDKIIFLLLFKVRKLLSIFFNVILFFLGRRTWCFESGRRLRLLRKFHLACVSWTISWHGRVEGIFI